MAINKDTGIKFPKQIKDFVFSSCITWGELGPTYEYNHKELPLKLYLTIYVYNFNKKKIPRYIKSKRMLSMFKDCLYEVHYLHEKVRSNWSHFVLNVNNKIPFLYRISVIDKMFSKKNKFKQISYLFLGTIKNRFIKVRVSQDFKRSKVELCENVKNFMNVFGMIVFNNRNKKRDRKCNACGKNNFFVKRLMVCSRCNRVRYCNVKCQRNDWKNHKHICIYKKN